MEEFMYDDERMSALKQVYDHLQDDESRKIYMARSMYSLSDDKDYMRDVVREMSISKDLLKWIKDKKRLLLFGGGTWGKAITHFFKDIKLEGIIDNNKSGQEINGYKVFSVDEIKDIKNCYIVLAILFKYREVEEQLYKYGVDTERIFVPARLVEERQYFDLPSLSFNRNEVFLDCGGFNGDTTLRFINATNQNYDHIYIFEPNKALNKECKQKLREVVNCSIISKGTWDSNGTMKFIEAGEGSRLNEESGDEIETTTIDSVLEGRCASFIKMDVEGAELKSLIGAKETIKKYKPKLAISVYHKRNDIWEIPMLVLQLNSDYKFYLRTYSFTGNDTVLYAV